MSSGETFRKNGRPLKISSLQAIQTLQSVETVTSISFEDKPQESQILLINKVTGLFQKLSTGIRAFLDGITFRRSIQPAIAATIGVLLLSTLSVAAMSNKKAPEIKYSLYAAKPLVLESSVHRIYSDDSKSQKLNGIFRQYNCPLEGLGSVFVEEAERNAIPWWLAAAISFQESGCGKKTPKVGGEETYNGWGWAVYGKNTHRFENWARGIETVSKYLGTKFFSKGITDTCDIMRVYTPPSNGSWCNGVNYFGDLIQNYSTTTN